MVADTAAAYIRERLARDRGAEVCILEICAGTGGTTAAILPALAPFKDHVWEYCYTDLSQAFLMHAEQQYAPGHAYLTTRLFDVSRPLDIHRKTEQEVRDVLAPKVAGLVHLDRATQHLDLDFLVCFSSLTAALGNPGQADYAAANAFVDAYAAYRNGLVTAGQRRGRDPLDQLATVAREGHGSGGRR